MSVLILSLLAALALVAFAAGCLALAAFLGLRAFRKE